MHIAKRSVLPANAVHHACLSFVNVHQMAPPLTEVKKTSNCSLLLIYRSRRDERLSCSGWLTYSGLFTHVSGHPSATGRAQDRESSPVKDRRSTAVPRNQPATQINSACRSGHNRQCTSPVSVTMQPDTCFLTA